ncbi:MAG: hypothetical protein JKY20_06610, partial [Alphaproteobacteria bacterium]|nr:hypothetical protein [Alphaproteobacteria bacterium]
MNRFVIIGLFGVIVIVVAIGLNYVGNQDEPTEASSSSARPGAGASGANDGKRSNYLSKRADGIPVPAPPPVAAYRPFAPNQNKTPNSNMEPAPNLAMAPE